MTKPATGLLFGRPLDFFLAGDRTFFYRSPAIKKSGDRLKKSPVAGLFYGWRSGFFSDGHRTFFGRLSVSDVFLPITGHKKVRRSRRSDFFKPITGIYAGDRSVVIISITNPLTARIEISFRHAQLLLKLSRQIFIKSTSCATS